jgi:hypothetical protein
MEKSKLDEKIEMISKLTTYSNDEILEKLQIYDGDATSVVREYMGIPVKKENNKIKNNQINQEIYRQIRKTLDDSMRQYRENNPINIDEVVHNLRESEEREKEKRKNKK